MGREEEHGMPDYVRRAIDNNNRMMYPSPPNGPTLPSFYNSLGISDETVLRLEKRFLKEDNEKLSAKVDDLTAKLASKDKEIADLNAKLAAKDKANTQMSVAQTGLKQQNSELQARVNFQDQTIIGLNGKSVAKEKVIEQLTADKKGLEARNSVLTSRVNEYERTVFDPVRGAEVVKIYETRRPTSILTFKNLLEGTKSIKQQEAIKPQVPKSETQFFSEQIKKLIYWFLH